LAIVSDTPGTTRDVIEARLDLGGYLLLIADTPACAILPSRSRPKACGAPVACEGGMTLLLLDGSAENPRAGLPGTCPSLT
jgi:tRNA modification GTPase